MLLNIQNFFFLFLGEGKVKNDQGQRRNRRVLGDIGNQEVVRIAEAKHRPITRLTPLSLSLSLSLFVCVCVSY